MTKPSILELLATNQLPCGACHATGTQTRKAFTACDGTEYPERVSECIWCEGKKYFTRPDVNDIWQAIKGRKPGTVKSKRPDDARSYYVWRMIRFHTGKDVTLPMTASLEVANDPYGDLLAAYADAISERLTGRQSAGRARWRSAWYGESPDPSLPESAQPGGPVADCDKPLSEALELV